MPHYYIYSVYLTFDGLYGTIRISIARGSGKASAVSLEAIFPSGRGCAGDRGRFLGACNGPVGGQLGTWDEVAGVSYLNQKSRFQPSLSTATRIEYSRCYSIEDWIR